MSHPAAPRSALGSILLALSITVGLAFIANLILGSKPPADNIPQTVDTRAQEEAAKRDQIARLEAQVKAQIDKHQLVVLKSAWRKEGFDNIAVWTVTFQNKSEKPVGNIRFRTAYSAETGTVVSKGGIDSPLAPGIIHRVIPASSTRTLEVNDGFIPNEAHKANFEVVSWEFVRDER